MLGAARSGGEKMDALIQSAREVSDVVAHSLSVRPKLRESIVLPHPWVSGAVERAQLVVRAARR